MKNDFKIPKYRRSFKLLFLASDKVGLCTMPVVETKPFAFADLKINIRQFFL